MNYSREAILRVFRPRYFYGWNIVGVGFIANMVSGLGVYTLAIFISPMTATFGWSRTVISSVQTIQTMGNGIAAPFIGPLVDSRGPRLLMVFGGFLAGLALILTSFVEASWQFFLFRGLLFALGMACVGGFVVSTAISKFFIRMRGRALAIGAMGLSVPGIFLPPIAALMIESYGWRTVWVGLGVLIWIMVIIPAAIFMRRSPEDLGLRPDGDSEEEAAQRRSSTLGRGSEAWASEGAVWTRRTIFACRSFWLIILAFGLGTLAMQGIFLHMIPYLEEQGFSRLAAAGTFTVQNFVSFVTKPFWGLAGERFPARYNAAVEFLLGGLGLLGIFLFAGNLVTIYIFAGLIGASIGGVLVNHQLVWGNSFGRQSLGLVRGIGQPFTVLFSALGPLVGGMLYDATNSYRIAMPLFIIAFFLSALVILFARPPQYDQTEAMQVSQDSAGPSAVALPARAPSS